MGRCGFRGAMATAGPHSMALRIRRSCLPGGCETALGRSHGWPPVWRTVPGRPCHGRCGGWAITHPAPMFFSGVSAPFLAGICPRAARAGNVACQRSTGVRLATALPLQRGCAVRPPPRGSSKGGARLGTAYRRRWSGPGRPPRRRRAGVVPTRQLTRRQSARSESPACWPTRRAA